MELALDDFRRLPATHIVSLGRSCATAYNLRRFYNFGDAFPFDWWIAPGRGVSEFIKSLNVDDLYDCQQLQRTADAASVKHRQLEFLLHHEFPRRWDLPDQRIADNWQDALSKPKSRTTALAAKFARMNGLGNRIAFIRESPSSNTKEDALDAIRDALNERFTIAEWTFVDFAALPQSQSDGWRGDPNAWDSKLSELAIELDRAGHKPFVENEAEPSRVAAQMINV